MIRREKSGIACEADPRHAEILVEQLDTTKAKAVTTPVVKDDTKCSTKEERQATFANTNDPECNVTIEETLDSDEVMSLHGWTRNADGMRRADLENATVMQVLPTGI